MTGVWAHRGASAYAPENTLPAFELAVEQGADGIEFDVQRSADGQLVVIHDEAINRTSTGFGKVVDLPMEALRRCDYANGFVGFRNVRIPTLREVLELLAPTSVTINIELKNSIETYPDMEHQALAEVHDAGVLDRVIFSSFNHGSLANLRESVGPQNLGLLFSDGLYKPWRYAAEFGAGAIHSPLRVLKQQPDLVWLAHEAGIKVHVWTANDPQDLDECINRGVDALITNMPDRAVARTRR